jgi:hypothetical protein
MPATDPMAFDEFGSERDRIKRQLAMVAQLRQANEPPEGKMNSGWYVKPSRTANLASLAGTVLTGMQARRANQDQQALDERMGADYNKWMTERPQTRIVKTPEEIPDTIAPGPMPEGMEGTPLQKTRLRLDKVEPTQAETIDWASRGMRNPLSKALASHYMEDAIVKQPEREAARQFKAEEAAKAREASSIRDIERHKNKLGELELLYNDKTKTREQQLLIEKMKDQTKRDLGLAEAKARVDAAHEKALAAGQNTKPVPNTVINKMSEAEQAADGFNSAFSTYKPEYGGLAGAAKAMGGRNPIAAAAAGLIVPETAKAMEESAQWWRNYENQAAMVKRHAMFGSAFTTAEQAAWDRASIKQGDTPEFIANALKEQTRLANIFHNRLRSQYITSGYSQIGDAFQERGATFDESPSGAPPVPAPTVRQPMPTRVPQRRSGDLPRGVVSFEQE